MVWILSSLVGKPLLRCHRPSTVPPLRYNFEHLLNARSESRESPALQFWLFQLATQNQVQTPHQKRGRTRRREVHSREKPLKWICKSKRREWTWILVPNGRFQQTWMGNPKYSFAANEKRQTNLWHLPSCKEISPWVRDSVRTMQRNPDYLKG